MSKSWVVRNVMSVLAHANEAVVEGMLQEIAAEYGEGFSCYLRAYAEMQQVIGSSVSELNAATTAATQAGRPAPIH